MRVKDSPYELPEQTEAAKVIEAIRKPGTVNRCLLLCAINQVYPALQDELYLSLVYGWSYETIERKTGQNIPMHKNSFYGYRRKAVSVYAFMVKGLQQPEP